MQPVKEFEVSEELKKRGIRSITKEGNTVCIKINDSCVRLGIYPQDFEKTRRSWDKGLKDLQFDKAEIKLVCQYLKGFLSERWNELKGNEYEIAGAGTATTNTNINIIPQIDIDKDLSFEDWQAGVADRYFVLKSVANRNFPALWYSLEFELSVNKILNIEKCTLPFVGILLGAPSGDKTLGLGLFRESKNTFYTDNFTPRSFVSNSTAVKREDLEKIDLLPKIKDKFFLTPELAPIFGKKYEDLLETICIITRIVDGEGFQNDTGAHGHRGYSGDYFFTWIGAGVDIPYHVHKILGTQGAKLYFFRLPETKKTNKEYLDQIKEDDFKEKKRCLPKSIN